jgi:predicted porin
MSNRSVRTSKRVALAAAIVAGVWSGAVLADDGKAEKSSVDKALEALVNGFYGSLDVSVDGSSKGMDGMVAYHINGAGTGLDYTNPKNGGAGPFGKVGWQPAISTNASGIGWRGTHAIPGWEDTKFLIQVEAQIALTEAPGLQTGYTAQTNGIKGGLGSGTTFIGFGGKDWGALKIGHSTTPYKKATDRLDPFNGMVGDMPVIMGNTGGDNRVEFNAAMDHAIWYESPKYEGFSYDIMYSPGQNRTADENLNLSGGSSNCTGGNVPGSGNLLLACDDGGFDDAFSVAFKFETKSLYLTAAYELHKNVNRNSDGIGSNAVPYGTMMGLGDSTIGPGSPYLNWAQFDFVASAFGATGSCTTAPSSSTYYCVNATPEFIGDIGDEAAYKVGGQWISDFGLTVDAIFERMTRKVPAALQFQNERQRNGWWLAFTQELGASDNVNLGWAHAGKTPGDPGGQHNFDPSTSAMNDKADMFTFAYKHKLDKQLYWYANVAETVNHGNAHYDLGGGGHGIKTDCHDGTTTPIIDYTSAGNTTWGGCKPKAISLGVNYKF